MIEFWWIAGGGEGINVRDSGEAIVDVYVASD
jgi:hypothetical protein